MFSSRTAWDLKQNRFSSALEQHKRSGKRLLDLTASNPTECQLLYDSMAILVALHSPASLQYQPLAQGLPAAREAVAGYYAERSVPVAAENIILTTSTSEAYSFVFRLLCGPGDEVLVPHPGYPLFDFLAAINDVKPVPYPLIYDHGWQIDRAALDAAITPRTRAVIVVNPNNPTGALVRGSELQHLNALCAARDLAIISDEVFLDYPLSVETPLTLAANHAALTFTLSGLSKVAGLPQMKVAWLAAAGPDALRRDALARLEVIADTYLSMNTPIQHAVPALLATRGGFQAQLLTCLKKNLSLLDAALSGQRHCSRLDVAAGWYATLRVPVTQSDEDLAIGLLQDESVLAHPGHFFDFPQDGYLIVSLMTPERDFQEGIVRILRYVALR